MKKISIAMAAGLAFSLAACGSADDASTEAEPDTVEVGAEEAISDVDLEPVEDPEAAALEAATAAAEEEAERASAAESAGDAAADVAAQVDAAMAESGDE